MSHRPETSKRIDKSKRLRKKITSAIQSEFVKNVATLLTGTAIGQGFALLLSPILTRLYSPEDFSAFEQYAFLLSVLTVVITGRYELAIVLPKTRQEAYHLVQVSMRFAFVASLLFFVVFFLFGESISEAMHNPVLDGWLWTLGPALFMIAWFNVASNWFIREKNFRIAATGKTLYSAAGESIKLGSGYFQSGTAGLIGGTIAGHLVSAAYAWEKFRRKLGTELKKGNNVALKSVAMEYRKYPMYAMWGGVLNNLAQWAHVAVFTFFYGEKALIPIGMIAFSRRIFFNPLGMLSTSYSQVFYQRISDIESAFELRAYYLKNLMRFLIFAAMLVAIVQLLPASSLGIIFGEKWTGALEYLKILSYWYALNFVIGSLSFIYYRLHLQAFTLLVDIFHFLIVILAFWYAWNNGYSEVEAIKLMVWAKVCYLLLNGLAVIFFLERNCRREKA